VKLRENSLWRLGLTRLRPVTHDAAQSARDRGMIEINPRKIVSWKAVTDGCVGLPDEAQDTARI